MINSGGLIYRNFIEENQVVSGNEVADGGGLLAWLDDNQSVIIKENRFRDNSVEAQNETNGGGLAFRGGSILCEGNEIFSNQCTSATWSRGGGIYFYLASDTVTGNMSIFRNNHITGNQLHSNEMLGIGGGFYQENGTRAERAQLYNNIISQNVADYGGAVFLDETAGAIMNNTFVDNIALQSAPSVVWVKGTGATVLFNNIIGMTDGSETSDFVVYMSDDALTLYIINNMIGKVFGIPSGAVM